MLKNHEKDMIEKALKFYKHNYPLVRELDKIHLTNLIEKVQDLPTTSKQYSQKQDSDVQQS